MNHLTLRAKRFILATSALIAAVAVLLTAASRAQVYRPAASEPAPELPPALLLTPRANFTVSAGLFGYRCQFDVMKNDMIFQGDQGVGGVRIPRLPKDTKFQVEFVVRAVSEAKFALTSSNGNNAPDVTSFYSGPKGSNRIFVHGKATKEKGGFASIRCFAKDANWSLVSAKVTPE